MQQIFIQQTAFPSGQLLLQPQQSHHLLRVLRMKPGEQLRVIDSENHVFLAEIRDENTLTILQPLEEDREVPCEVVLLAALIKGERWDWLLQKCTELGVSRIVPFHSSRTVVKVEEQKTEKKVQRWQKIVQEAAQQCKRTQIPQVHEPVSLKQADQWLRDQNFVAYEDQALKGGSLLSSMKQGKSVTLVIGPEGGFSSAEIGLLIQQGYQCCSLGKRILRAETAAVAAVCTAVSVLEETEHEF